MSELSVLFQLVVSLSVFFVWTLRYDNVVKEFNEFGYSDTLRNFVGAFKISSSVLLIVGIWYNDLILIGSISMAFFMFSAQISHIRQKNPFSKLLPSLIFLLMSIYISLYNYGLI